MRHRLGWLFALAFALVASVAFGHDEAPHEVAGDLTLSAHELTRFLHVVLLVFWMGPEIGIMVAGHHAVDTSLSAAQRAGAARLMQYYDIMPRVCMSLMLTVGGVLSEQVGLEHPWWQMAGIWLLGPVWLALTLWAYFTASDGAAGLADRLETALRIVLIVAVPVSVAWSISTDRLAAAPYVGGKLILFAAVLLLGLLARRAWGPFRAAAKELLASGASAELDARMTGSFRSGRLYVYLMWVALLVAALMGIVKAGAPDAG